MSLECFLRLFECGDKCKERDLHACDECDDDDEESVDDARVCLVLSFDGYFGGGGTARVLPFECDFMLGEHVLKDVSWDVLAGIFLALSIAETGVIGTS